MKQFNLEEALSGKPVRLRAGHKAYVLCNVNDYFKNNTKSACLAGIRSCLRNDDYYSMLHWDLSGNIHGNDTISDYDIIEMWEEPELTQEELFEKALKERLPLRYKGLSEDYADVYVVAKSMSGSYILEWKDGTDTCVSILSNLPKFKWYLASEKPVKETGSVGLPKPFIPKKGEQYYSISPSYDEPEHMCANYLNHPSIQNGNCFRTKADAQKWIDFMKSQIEE